MEEPNGEALPTGHRLRKVPGVVVPLPNTVAWIRVDGGRSGGRQFPALGFDAGWARADDVKDTSQLTEAEQLNCRCHDRPEAYLITGPHNQHMPRRLSLTSERKDGRAAMLGVTGQHAGIDKWEGELHRQDDFIHNRVWKGQNSFPLEKFIAQHRNAFVSMTQCAMHVQF